MTEPARGKMSRAGSSLMALVASAIVLAIAAWFDGTFLRDALRNVQANFDSASIPPLVELGSLLVAGAVLLLGVLAWRAASAIVSLVYAVVGAFFVALPWLVWTLPYTTNGASPVLPETVTNALARLWISTSGQLNAMGTIGAGMLVAGIFALVRSWRGRVREPRNP